MTRTPKPSVRRSVEVGKCAIVAALAFLAVASAGATSQGMSGVPETSSTSTGTSSGQVRLDKLIARHDCSPTGFGADVIPGSSLVLQDNKVRHVSFDDGWAVYTGEQSGTLLAVCRPAL